MSFHFGCCMACRAPFMPDADFFSQQESQAVFYLQMRFKQLSEGVANSDFTGKRERGHLISKSRYRFMFRWASKLPVARILASIEGWNADGSKMKLTDANSFFVYPNDTTGDSTDTEGVYHCAWDRPSDENIVDHTGLRNWIAAEGSNMNSVSVDDDFTTPCCSLCNDIYDCWARMRMYTTERDLVPAGAISVVRRGKGKAAVNNIVNIPNAKLKKPYLLVNLGSLVSYYMHGSMISMMERKTGAPDITQTVFRKLQPLLVLLMWFPLHLVCLEAEMRTPMSEEGKSKPNSKGKAAHNYLGNMDMVISYYMWLCAQSADTSSGALEFERFCVTCVKEIVDSPPPVWNSSEFPRLTDYIFDESCPGGETDIRARIAHVSDRLVTMYRDVFAPLVPLFKGYQCSPQADLALQEKGQAYFLSGLEAKEFMINYTPNVNPDNIKYFLDYAGIGAVLWQLRRYLSKELPALRNQLDRWIVARLSVEYSNIARNAPQDLSHDGAHTLYCMQNSLRPEVILGGRGTLGSGAELAVISVGDPAAVSDLIKKSGRCSVWKAAHRLKKWKFTEEAKPRQVAFGATRGRAMPVAGAFIR